MISFIIIDRDKKTRDLHNHIIKNFFYKTKDRYKVYEYENYNNTIWKEIENITGKRIYILDYDIPNKNGIKLSEMIRKSGDITNPIILTSNIRKDKVKKFAKNTLILNIIFKDNNLIKEMWNTIIYAYQIITKYAALTFSIFDELYRLPYDDIYYIEKNSNIDSVTIYTKDDTYTYYISIKKIFDKLSQDARFFKTHRSCIVNLFNISQYNKKDNIVVFKNGLTTDLVCRNQKKNLINMLENNLD